MSIYNLFAKLGFSALAEPAPPPEQDLEQQPDNDQKEEIKISTESKDDESEQQPRVKPHLVIVTDSTGSMGTYLQGLRVSLKQIFPLVSLTDAFDRVAILWYHDYCDKKQVGCSPWARDFTELVKHAEGLMPDGGGDYPEAAKTAAYELVKLVAKAPSGNKVPTIVFWYADAPPHHATNKSSDNYDKELKVLGASRFDWMNICRHLRENNIIVYPIVTGAFPFFAAMAEITGGRCIQPAQLTTNGISFTTMNALMGILGTQHDPAHCYSVPQNFNPQAMENEAGACLVQGAGSENVLLNARVPLNLNAFVRRIPRDEEYTTLAFRVFDQLVQPDTVLALTTNNVFGTFWRALCKQREDPRRDELVARLGGVKTKLPPKEQEELKQWLDQSYNRLEDIQEAIKKVPTYPALVLELPEGDKYSAQDLLEISRSCNSQILKRLTTLVVNMRMVEAGPLPEDYLPISLDDRNLFSFLPHLMCQGTTFDRRASMLMAAVCTLARHPQLAERANEFLMREKGKGWQQWELPESFAAGFVRLLLRVPHALTEEELVNVQKLNRIASFVFNLNTALQTEVPYTPSKSIRRDRKERCVECNLLRSLTLLSPTGVCGLCLQAAQPLPPGGFQGKNACVHVAPRVEEGSVSELKGGAAHAEPCDDDHSFMVECAECHGIYALVRVALLSARPKCFYCRNGGRAPVRTCQVCTNRFVMPRASDWDEKQLAEPYTCASCEFHPELAWEAATVTVKQLLEHDRAAVERVLALTIPEEFVRSGMLSLFKLKELIAPRPESEMPIFCWPRVALAAGDDVEDAEKKEKIADDQPDHEHKRDEEIKLEVAPLVTLKGKPVRHSGAVWSQMQQWCSTQNAQLGTCMLCFSDVPKFRLSRCCGRRRCETLACRDCLTQWYGQVKRGELVMASHLACPFCKNTPTFKAVRQFNAAAGDLLRTRNPEFEATWWYGWCRTCDCIQQAVEKNCAAETPVLNNFQCGGCRERQLDNAVKVKARECPNCSVMVEKIDGCNHITCNCGTHWCFACGGAFDDGNIYDHMAEAHGGGYFAEDEE